MDENNYERNNEGRNVRLPLPVQDGRADRTVSGGPLPPIVPSEWDRINNKHGSNHKINSHRGEQNQEYDDNEYETRFNDYENLKARRHIRHGEDSGSDAAHNLGDRRDSSDNNNYFIDENSHYEKSKELKDSVNHNVDSSSKKSEILRSEDSNGRGPINNEQRIPPVPLSREIAPDSGSHMQTEKQASAEDMANTKAGKVMVKGKVKQVKADIDQGPNPEKTYKRVEDFFQSQRESSIVEIPNAVKKEEASKLYKDNFIPVKDASDQVDKEQGESNAHATFLV